MAPSIVGEFGIREREQQMRSASTSSRYGSRRAARGHLRAFSSPDAMSSGPAPVPMPTSIPMVMPAAAIDDPNGASTGTDPNGLSASVSSSEAAYSSSSSSLIPSGTAIPDAIQHTLDTLSTSLAGDAYLTLPNPHALPESPTNLYFAPVYRVYVPTSTSISSGDDESSGGEEAVKNMEECEAQLQSAGVWPRWIRVGDIVANLGYVPGAGPGGEVDEPSWMTFDGRRLVRFDPTNPPLPTSAPAPAPAESELEEQGSNVIAAPVQVRDAITAGIPCPTYYAHILRKGTNPIWPLSIPVHLLPRAPVALPDPATSIPPPTSSHTKPHALTTSLDSVLKSVPFSLVQTMSVVASHKGPLRVQRYAWTARCDFRSRLTPPVLSGLGEAIDQEAAEDVIDKELGLWAGEWVLEVEGTREGRAKLERILEESYRFGYGHPKAGVWKWEVVLERCEGDVLWLRYVDYLLSCLFYFD